MEAKTFAHTNEKQTKSESGQSKDFGNCHCRFSFETQGNLLSSPQFLPVHWREFMQDTNITFCCNGYCVKGANVKSVTFVCLVSTAPSLVFFISVSVPYFHWILTLLLGVWLVIILTLMFKTAFMDPGFLPRAFVPPLQDPNRKICQTCNIYRPLRSRHCRVCDLCVLKHDHHCPWIGACIGKRNYRYFLSFIFLVNVYACVLSALCLWWIYKESVKLCEAWKTENTVEEGNFTQKSWLEFADYAILQNPATVVIAVYGLLTGCILAALSLFHCKLLCLGITTNEYFKQTWKHLENPDNKGCFLNFVSPFLEELPRSFVISGKSEMTFL